jgi:hypothetical protein
MTSAWWLLVAFVGGGSAGILLMALMQLAGGLLEQSDKCPRGSIANDPIRVPGRTHDRLASYRPNSVDGASCFAEIVQHSTVKRHPNRHAVVDQTSQRLRLRCRSGSSVGTGSVSRRVRG